jgi:hypothetical protein
MLLEDTIRGESALKSPLTPSSSSLLYPYFLAASLHTLRNQLAILTTSLDVFKRSMKLEELLIFFESMEATLYRMSSTLEGMSSYNQNPTRVLLEEANLQQRVESNLINIVASWEQPCDCLCFSEKDAQLIFPLFNQYFTSEIILKGTCDANCYSLSFYGTTLVEDPLNNILLRIIEFICQTNDLKLIIVDPNSLVLNFQKTSLA